MKITRSPGNEGQAVRRRNPLVQENMKEVDSSDTAAAGLVAEAADSPDAAGARLAAESPGPAGAGLLQNLICKITPNGLRQVGAAGLGSGGGNTNCPRAIPGELVRHEMLTINVLRCCY